MDRSGVVLIGLESPYREALVGLCQQYEATVSQRESVDTLGFEPSDTGLCVIEVEGEANSTLEAVRKLRKTLKGVPLVVLTHPIDVDSVMQMVRLGVSEVIGLPASPGEVATRALEFSRIDTGQDATARIIGQGPSIRQVKKDVRQAANSNATVLITGETGSGKQLVAQAIHLLSDRASKPFVHVDCGLLAPNLVESELFGHEKGSFTGATQRRVGRFELAGDGTIFLDEIGEMATQLQTSCFVSSKAASSSGSAGRRLSMPKRA